MKSDSNKYHPIVHVIGTLIVCVIASAILLVVQSDFMTQSLTLADSLTPIMFSVFLVSYRYMQSKREWANGGSFRDYLKEKSTRNANRVVVPSANKVPSTLDEVQKLNPELAILYKKKSVASLLGIAMAILGFYVGFELYATHGLTPTFYERFFLTGVFPIIFMIYMKVELVRLERRISTLTSKPQQG